MTMNKYVVAFLLFSLIGISPLLAQNTYSPYSSLGLGEIYSGDKSQMGGIGIGIHNKEWLNTSNPAGVAAIDSLAGIFEVGVFAKGVTYLSNSRKDKSFSANFNKIAFGFRGKKWWSFSFGIKPYSNVGYHVEATTPVEGGDSQTIYYEGSGGLYNLYATNAFKIGAKTSVGIISSMIAGEITHSQDVVSYKYTTTSRATQFYNKFGVQHQVNNLTLGATYGYKQNITFKNTISSYNSNNVLQSEESERNTTLFIPQSFGIGFSYQMPRLLLAGEYELEKWAGLPTSASVSFTDVHKIKIGATYKPIRDVYTMHLAKQYQMGISINKSNIEVRNKAAWNYAISSGVTLPLRANQAQRALLHLGVEFGSNLTAPRGYLKENYLLLSVNFSLIEAMFMRNRIF